MKTIVTLCSGVLCGLLVGLWLNKETPSQNGDIPAPTNDSKKAQFDAEDLVNLQKPADIETSIRELLAAPEPWDRIHDMVVLSAEWSSEDLDAASTFLKGNLSEDAVEMLFSVVLTRWSHVDPDAALAFSIELKNEANPLANRLFRQQITNWAQQDPNAVWQYAEHVSEDRDLSANLRYAALSAIAKDDASRALRLYQTLEYSPGIDGLMGIISFELAKVDLAHAKALLLESPKREQRAILNGLLQFYATSDPAAGLAYLTSLPSGIEQNYGLAYTLVGQWVRNEPRAALTQIQSMPPGQIRDQTMASAMNIWAQRDLESAINWMLPQLKKPEIVRAWQQLSYTMVRADPERGMALIRQHPELNSIQDSYFSSWIQTDVTSALDWAFENLEAADLAETLGRSVHAVASSDPVAATQIVDLMPASDSRDRALASVARRLADRDLPLAVSWVLEQPEDSAQKNALSQVLSVWAKGEPEAAAQFLEDSFQTENALLKQDMVRQVASTWAENDPLTALQWVKGLDSSEAHDKALASVLFEWSRKDLNGASAYVSEIEATEERSAHYSRLVLAAVREDPMHAIAWVETLPEGDRSDSVYSNLYSHWLQRDSVAASEWINELPKGHIRDLAATQIVSEIHDKAPKDALPWALEIDDENMRNRALGYVIRSASRNDLDVLRESIEAVSDEKQRQRYERQYFPDQ